MHEQSPFYAPNERGELQYFADERDAATWRKVAAEREARDAQRRTAHGARQRSERAA